MSTPSDPFSKPPATPAWQGSPTWDASAPVSGQPYGPPPSAWSAGPVAHTGPTSTSTQAVIALCCALGSFVVFPLVPAIVALALLRGARDEIDGSGGRITGEGLLTATKVLAWVNIALCALGVLAFVLLFGVLAVGGFS